MPEIVDRLRMNFELEDTQVFSTDGPVNLSRLMNLYTDTPRPDLKFKDFLPRELRLQSAFRRSLRRAPSSRPDAASPLRFL